MDCARFFSRVLAVRGVPSTAASKGSVQIGRHLDEISSSGQLLGSAAQPLEYPRYITFWDAVAHKVYSRRKDEGRHSSI